MHPPRAIPPRRTRRPTHTPNRRTPRQVNRLRNENQNGGSGTSSTPNILEALLPMFRMQRQLLELSRNFCQRMRDKIDKVEESRRRTSHSKNSPKEKWTHKILLTGVLPEDIKVVISDDQLIVSSRKNNFATRTLNLPFDINTERLTSYLMQDGNLVFEAPFKRREYSENSSQTRDSGEGDTSLEHMREELTAVSNNDGQSRNADDEEDKHDDTSLKHEKKDEEKAVCVINVPVPIEHEDKKTDNGEDSNNKTESTQTNVIENCNRDNAADSDISDNRIGPIENEITHQPKTESNDKEEKMDHESSTDGQKSPSNALTKQDMFKFQFNLTNLAKEDVKISVKGHTLIVKAEIEETNGDMAYTESIQRRYNLPENVDVQQLQCLRKTDGSFHISAPYQDTERCISVMTED